MKMICELKNLLSMTLINITEISLTIPGFTWLLAKIAYIPSFPGSVWTMLKYMFYFLQLILHIPKGKPRPPALEYRWL